jgi:hypothetical protein
MFLFTNIAIKIKTNVTIFTGDHPIIQYTANQKKTVWYYLFIKNIIKLITDNTIKNTFLFLNNAITEKIN